MSNDWFRSWHGAPTDPKWRTIAKKADVPTSLVVAYMWALMDRASQADDRGSYAGVDLEVLADYLDCDETQLKRIETQCNARNVSCNGRLVSWEKRQPKREDDRSTERVRAFRERHKKQSVAVDETQCNAMKRTETLDKIRLDISLSNDKDKRARRASPSVEFQKFWEAWPNKVGKPAAEKAFAKVASEVDAIVEGVAAYVRDKPADRPWLNPATFINQRRWEDKPADKPCEIAKPRERDLRNVPDNLLSTDDYWRKRKQQREWA